MKNPLRDGNFCLEIESRPSRAQ